MRTVSDFDLRLLRVFMTVAESGGYAASQSKLNIGPSTISLHMKDLENRLGIRLCERGRGGFRLTERGQAVYDQARNLLRGIDDFGSAVTTIRKSLSGRVAIGIVDSLVTHPMFPLPEALKRFNRVDNSAHIELVVDSRQELERAVLEGALHMAVGPYIQRIKGLDFTPLFAEEHRVYCGKDHKHFGARKRPTEVTSLEGLSVVVRGYHEDFDRERFKGARIAASVFNMEAMLLLLLSGAYVGFLPVHVAEPWLERKLLHTVPLPGLAYTSQHALFVRRGLQAPPAVAEFLRILRERI